MLKVKNNFFDNLFFDPFDWDFDSYKFNRDVKDMSPYTTKQTEDGIVLIHNVLGINKEDLKLTKKIDKGVSFLVIEGKTTDEITGKEYSINSRFHVDVAGLDMSKITSSMKNGLLYINIPYRKVEEKTEDIINID